MWLAFMMHIIFLLYNADYSIASKFIAHSALFSKSFLNKLSWFFLGHKFSKHDGALHIVYLEDLCFVDN